MKNNLKRYIIKIPVNVLVLYSEKEKVLIFKINQKYQLINLRLKIIVLKHKNLLIVTNKLLRKISKKYKNSSKNLRILTVSLIKQSLLGITSLIVKQLKLIGIGYKVFLVKKTSNFNFLHFMLGHSHSLYYKVPQNITIKVLHSTRLFLFGFDYKLLCKTAAIIKKLKLPEPYKGKGILYENETISLKKGKKV